MKSGHNLAALITKTSKLVRLALITSGITKRGNQSLTPATTQTTKVQPWRLIHDGDLFEVPDGYEWPYM
jgi:hypothetical protein